MRYSQAEKYEIIRLVEGSELGVLRTLRELDIPKSSFYTWYGQYIEYGYDGLADKKSNSRKFWNKIPDHERERVCSVSKPSGIKEINPVRDFLLNLKQK
ncbi:MAG: hypothetical protein HN528_09050, partial [Candidatus Marinimicrobia bacterium]|nr:hypothetical protein [Candidatus Neomarinimicrobiota bacterium]